MDTFRAVVMSQHLTGLKLLLSDWKCRNSI